MSLSILDMASALAGHAADRQRVIAGNVANADTPGFRARDLPDFATLYRADAGFALRATRPGHLAMPAGASAQAMIEANVMGAESPNGNTVSLEDQMIRAAQARQQHDLALGVFANSLSILRSSIGRAR